MVETRLITLDAGSHLNRTAVSYSNLKESLPIVTGIVLHERTVLWWLMPPVVI